MREGEPHPVDWAFPAQPRRLPTIPRRAGIAARYHTTIRNPHEAPRYQRHPWLLLSEEWRSFVMHAMLLEVADDGFFTHDMTGTPVTAAGQTLATNYGYQPRLFSPSSAPARLYNQTDDYADDEAVFTYEKDDFTIITTAVATVTYDDALRILKLEHTYTHSGSTIVLHKIYARVRYAKQVSSIGNDERPLHVIDTSPVIDAAVTNGGQVVTKLEVNF